MKKYSFIIIISVYLTYRDVWNHSGDQTSFMILFYYIGFYLFLISLVIREALKKTYSSYQKAYLWLITPIFAYNCGDIILSYDKDVRVFLSRLNNDEPFYYATYYYIFIASLLYVINKIINLKKKRHAFDT